MRGDILQLIEFFELLGKVIKTENMSDDVETLYQIQLEPDQSTVALILFLYSGSSCCHLLRNSLMLQALIC